VVGDQELQLTEPVAIPATEAHEERERARSRSDPSCLRVEAEERAVGRRTAGQAGESLTVDRQSRGLRFDPNDASRGVDDRDATNGFGESLHEGVRGTRASRASGIGLEGAV
jgi:hypothetical protein